MTELPNLPKTNKQREATFSLKFREWIMANPRVSCTFEMKDTRGKNYLNFKEVGDKQIAYGLAVNSDKGVLIRVQGINGEPDYAYYRNAPSHIVIKYPKGWVMVTTETFIMEKKRSKVKSLTYSRAKDIAVIHS